MKQINNDNLIRVINLMKIDDNFDSFINNRKKRILKLQKNNSFNYIISFKRKRKVKGVIKEEKHKRKIRFEIKKHDCFDQYLKLLSDNLENIIICDSKELISWKLQFEKIDFSNIKLEIKAGFFEEILKTLNYKDLRSGDNNLLFKFYNLLGVKACVYCNSQHVILLKTSEKARLQADHNLPKAQYPHFSITLSNLYPTCNNCNHLKGEQNIKYNLYYINKPIDELTFELDPNEISKFYSNQLNENNLTVKFDQGSTKINDILKIDEIYENHKDYVSDLLRIYKVYSTPYLKQLNQSFNNIFGNEDALFNKMIFGTSFIEEDINERVFSKLRLDIKNQLDRLIK